MKEVPGARLFCLLWLTLAGALVAQPHLSFPESWYSGTERLEPPLQVHQVAERTWILRQSILTHFEAPFLYLLAGSERAVLLDSGAPRIQGLRETVDRLIGADFPLVVAHSHAHGDHVAGDSHFVGRTSTEIVGHSPEEVADFFGLERWPEGSAELELGERVLEVLPIPGHEPSSIAIYDSATATLLTGDTLYPGRLYVRDEDAYRQSITRLSKLAETKPVEWILGAHIEMSRLPGRDYERGALSHQNERSLQLTVDQLRELSQSLARMTSGIERSVHDAFIVVPLDQ